jgi:hypothetical protein
MIPKRAVSLGLFFLLVASVVAALNLLAWNAATLTSLVGETGTQAFALSGSGTLANWVCSLGLFLCSGICIQLFYLRRHKRDDYGGMYYVWLVMAAMFFVASIDCAIDLRTIFAKLFEAATQRSLIQTPWLMMTIELIVLAVIVIRMLFEVRVSRLTLAAVLLVWLGFVGCIVLRNSEIDSSIDWLDQKVAYGNCVLLGCIGSLAALTVYARFVFLHAHGLIQLKVDLPQEPMQVEQSAKTATKKSTRAKKKATPEPTEEPVSTGSASVAKKPQSATAQKASKTTTRSKLKPTGSSKSAAPAVPKANPGTAKTARKKAASKPAAPTPTKPVAKTAPKVEVTGAQPDDSQLQQELEEIETVSISKSERRRLRKLAKRAARAKKAA